MIYASIKILKSHMLLFSAESTIYAQDKYILCYFAHTEKHILVKLKFLFA